ncbi:hypothetical protein [Sphingobium sp. CCH11-B1]|uniref:hypothetical protein n=1 Tax=Sphingobium sp. CCH11-B1 TaxID=1768781 RepID=UPI000ADD724D|nr:hypothetical protein [Sphingobium sp. CCH11-B1]
MSDFKGTPGPWTIFSTIRRADGKVGHGLCAGINSYGDGPAHTVGEVFGFSKPDLSITLAATAMLDALRKVEHWLDVSEEEFASMHDVDAMTHREQLANVRAAIAKSLGEQA